MRLNNLFLLILLSFNTFIKASDIANSLTIEKAQKAYEKSDYKSAIKLYESLVNANLESADLYFNLGNAYFKNQDLGLAILYYEKAKKINPTDDDILNNLKIANQRIEDKIDVAPELFLNSWKKSIVELMSEKAWSRMVIILFIISLFLIAIYFTSNSKKNKQIGFFGGITMIIITAITFSLAYAKYNDLKSNTHAVVVVPVASANGSPFEKGTRLFVIHEGTKVKINEESGDWTEITIANNSIGWIKSSTIKKI